jgi:hypothetical protein
MPLPAGPSPEDGLVLKQNLGYAAGPSCGGSHVVGWWGALWLAGVAEAADCAAPYTMDQMINDLTAVETFLRNGDNTGAGQAATNLEGGLACMSEVLPRLISGRAIRAIGAGLIASGDPEKGEDWLRTAVELEPSFEFGIEDLPAVHPVRDVYTVVRDTIGEEIPVEGATLSAGGVVWLDGRKLTEPKARIDRFHIVQYDSGGAVRSWIIDGNRFPDEVLAMAAPVAETKKPKPSKAEEPVASAKLPKPVPEPKVKTPKAAQAMPDPASQVEIGRRKRPWEKTPLMISGLAVSGLAGGVYLLHLQQLSKFNDLSESALLEQQQAKTNQLYVASLAILAVGTGTFTWGVIVDGGAPSPALRIRF